MDTNRLVRFFTDTISPPFPFTFYCFLFTMRRRYELERIRTTTLRVDARSYALFLAVAGWFVSLAPEMMIAYVVWHGRSRNPDVGETEARVHRAIRRALEAEYNHHALSASSSSDCRVWGETSSSSTTTTMSPFPSPTPALDTG